MITNLWAGFLLVMGAISFLVYLKSMDEKKDSKSKMRRSGRK